MNGTSTLLKLITLFAMVALPWSAATCFGQQAEMDRARELLSAGRAADAYAILRAREFDFAGNVEFDYLLGISALEAGRADRATLALERVLVSNPDFAGARLDIARAYFALGDLVRARAEFETVARQNPPPAARATVERYLEAIVKREQDQTQITRVTGYLEGALGRDSNVNNSTAQSLVYVPLFDVSFRLSSTSVKTADNYGAVGGGALLTHQIDGPFSLVAGVDARVRANARVDAFDNSSYDTRGGVQYASGADLLRVLGNYGRYYLDHTYNRDTTGLSAEYQRRVSLKDQLNAYALHSRTRYPSPLLKSNNVDFNLIGAGYLRTVGEKAGVQIGGTLFAGREKDTDERIDGARRIHGLRANAQAMLAPSVDAFLAAGFQSSDYRRLNIVFSEARRDRQYDIGAGVSWRFARDWSLRPVVTFLRNDSNISVNDYDRYDVSLTLRRDF
jgi:tetratricopeptide (TPR) repeat protein